MSGLKFSLFLMMFLVLASQFFMFEAFAEANEDVAALALTDAEGVVVSAYRAVLEAEQAGANVSGLLGQLNKAGENLTLARITYRQGDFEKAADFANSSKDIGEEVQNAAISLKNSASYESVQRMWLTMIGSVVGAVAVLLGSFWVWRVFRRRYYRRVLGMKPEVSSSES